MDWEEGVKTGNYLQQPNTFLTGFLFFCFYLPRGLVLLEVTVGCLTSVTPLCCARAALLEAALPKHIAPSLWGGSVQVERNFPGPFSFFSISLLKLLFAVSCKQCLPLCGRRQQGGGGYSERALSCLCFSAGCLTSDC